MGTWDDNDGKNYPFVPDHSVAFPMMEDVQGHQAHPKQPLINKDSFVWPGDEGGKRKAVPGVFVLDKYLTPTTIGDPIEKPECAADSNDNSSTKDEGTKDDDANKGKDKDTKSAAKETAGTS